MLCYFSDFSGSEEITKKHKHRKRKRTALEENKKRRRSSSMDSSDFQKLKNKKNKSRKDSGNESNDDSSYYKNKPKKSSYTSESRNKRSVANDSDERKYGSSSRRNKDTSKEYSGSRKKKSSRDVAEDDYITDRKKTKDSQKVTEDRNSERERDYKNTGSEKNSSRKNKNDDDMACERYDRGSPLHDSEENGRNSSTGSEKPYRYWSTSRGPVRKNSDSYWNKYSERLKEQPENVEVGPRYYSVNDSPKNENSKTSNEKSKGNKKENAEVEKVAPTPRPKKVIDDLTTRTGGAYIPPAKLRMMQESITDKASAAYQRLAWEALKKSIQGHVNKVNTSNIQVILKAVQKENIVRGRGLLCRALIQAQAASPTFTNVYAAFIAALNAKFPKLGELLLKRLVVQFRRGFKRNDKTICITAATFIAHLVNQEVAHEILALEILTLLIETPTDDSVEVAIAFLKECGMKLTEVSSKGILAIFDMLRNILHEGKLEKRVQYMIEVMFQIRKEDFKAHPSLISELDLIDEEDKIQHMITLEDNHDPEDILNVFKLDPDYEANEAKYKSLVGDSDDESGEDGSDGSGDSDDDSEEEEGEGEEGESKGVIIDKTETNLVALRKTIYLTIQSSLDFEECAHKLLRMELKPGQEIEMAHMFLDCCAEQRTYEKFFGLLSQRFCQINRTYVGPFEETFRDSYATIHRMSNDKLRNVAKLFAHLLYTDAISWEVLSTVRLNEDDTTSSSRIFIKILFQELSEYMGLIKLNQRVKDPLQTALEGLFPRDNPKHTRFAINFFTSIGLGGLTDELREHLKAQPKQSIVVPQLVEGLSSSSSSSSDSSSSSSSDSSSDSSSSESSSSDSEGTSSRRKRKGKPVNKNKKQPTKKVEKATSKKSKITPSKRKRDR
ncbi:pre-mRNA-splicing factor cwc22 [Homalodisca vitripennis]|nr:pre-mRNA-splicing factor cwc22 [Homalodisca vitripennis]